MIILSDDSLDSSVFRSFLSSFCNLGFKFAILDSRSSVFGFLGYLKALLYLYFLVDISDWGVVDDVLLYLRFLVDGSGSVVVVVLDNRNLLYGFG